MNLQITAAGVSIPIPLGLSGTTTNPKLSLAPLGNNTKDLTNSLGGGPRTTPQQRKRQKEKIRIPHPPTEPGRVPPGAPQCLSAFPISPRA